ncbi:hypothetical protein JCM24511_03664 [Saitozyma sp. JCM 24511]|nr:hypothetical protein JCM24511_03664 [Saitozyma sp. JCM 24511]
MRGVAFGDVRPAPGEAYLILRLHRRPRGGWGEVASKSEDPSSWTYELLPIQQPVRGRALQTDTLRKGWPCLSPPLVFQLSVYNSHGRSVPIDHPELSRRLVHMTMQVDLVSPDGLERRAQMLVPKVAPGSRLSPSESGPSSCTNHVPVRTVLGSTFRCVQTLSVDNRRGLFFLFPDLVVRPVGSHAFEGRLIDVAGPRHIGTSIGVTRPVTRVRTQAFENYHPNVYPGAHPITDLSRQFLAQGERYLGRKTRSDDLDVDVDDGITSIDDEGDLEEDRFFAQGRGRSISVSALRT